jgi:flagellar biosynthesis protein FlhG
MDEIKKKLWAIGGGKGGVGKSIVSIMLGASLARQGKKVILVDADLGGSNLHTLVGIKYPLYTLADFINRQVENIEEVVMDTPVENMQLICGADDILGIANPKNTQKNRLFNHLKNLKADYIVLDLGAGASFTTMDFFLFAPNKICVLTPQITSIQNAYGFIKASMYRGLMQVFRGEPGAQDMVRRASSAIEGENIDSIDTLKDSLKNLDEHFESDLNTYIESLKINTIVNMVRNDREKEVGNIVKSVAENYLNLPLANYGYVPYDRILVNSINHMPEFLKNRKDSMSSMSFYEIAGSIIRDSEQPSITESRFSVKVPASRL